MSFLRLLVAKAKGSKASNTYRVQEPPKDKSSQVLVRPQSLIALRATEVSRP